MLSLGLQPLDQRPFVAEAGEALRCGDIFV